MCNTRGKNEKIEERKSFQISTYMGDLVEK